MLRAARPALLRLAADGGDEDARAVDRDLDLMRMLETADRLEVGAVERQRKVILGVEREVVVDDQAPDRSERKTFDVLVLRSVLPDAVGVRAWRDRRSDGERADPISSHEIPFEQCRRRAQEIGVVVESERRVVRRNQRRHVDIEGKQIAHRVRVFGAIETTNERTTRIRRRRAGTIQLRFQPRRQGVVGRLIRSRHALRRHRTRPELADHVLPDLTIRARARDVETVERET